MPQKYVINILPPDAPEYILLLHITLFQKYFYSICLQLK